MALWIVLIVVAVLVIFFISSYNSLVALRNQSEEANAAIDAHLKQRYDLIPNLVETVKGYAKHEEGTLTAVIAARNAAMSATGFDEKQKAENALSGTLKTLFALSEAYPDLKANASFLNLQNQLQKIETDLLSARKYYNAVVKNLNNKIDMFPSNIVAKLSHFEKKGYVEIETEARARVDVKF
jgi:Uncharacterized conserved protein